MMADFQQAQRNVSTVLSLFSHRRRRYALRGLRMQKNPMELADLAEEVAIREHKRSISDIAAEEIHHIHLTLYHTHIPKLIDEQFVRYDHEQDSVALLERAINIDQYQELLTVE